MVLVNVTALPLVTLKLQPLLVLVWVVPFHEQLPAFTLFVKVPEAPDKERVTVSVPEASVNVVCAWETEPTAVRVILIFKSAASVLNELLEIFPLTSAVVGVVRVIGLSLSRSGSTPPIVVRPAARIAGPQSS